MNEYAICSLQTEDPLGFQIEINKMVKEGYQVDGPMSVFPFLTTDKLGMQTKAMLFFIVLMKRPIVNLPK